MWPCRSDACARAHHLSALSAGAPKRRYADADKWHESGAVEPNDTEVLFIALLLVEGAQSAEQLHIWAHAVLDDEQRAAELGASWKPLESWGRINNQSKLWLPLQQAYADAAWPDALLDKIGSAMQGWAGSGQYDGLRADALRKHRTRKLLGKKDARAVREGGRRSAGRPSRSAGSRGSSTARGPRCARRLRRLWRLHSLR